MENNTMGLTLNWKKDYLFWSKFNSDLLNDPRLTQKFQSLFGTSEIPIIGVYIIFAGVYNDTTVYVGSGFVKNRFSEHLKNLKDWTTKYGTLYATWADTTFPIALSSYHKQATDTLRGIEKFVGDILDPKESHRLPKSVESVVVNLPVWEQPANANPFMRLGAQLKANPFE